MKFKRVVCFVAIVLGGAILSAAAAAREYKSGLDWPEPKAVDPGPPGGPPSDAIVLFDGKSLDKWENGGNWIINKKEGYATAAKSGIRTKQAFGDIQLHIEWASPAEVKGNGQGRGNSGVYLMGRYEVQILDSYKNKTYYDGQAGAIYKQTPPLVNASRKPGEWQTYDIIFKAPRFTKEGKLESPAYVTVLHNGVLIQNHFELQGGTSYVRPPSYSKHPPKLPLNLQFHGNPVRFRNIWVRELNPIQPRNAVVEGRVLSDGKPLAGAQVQLHPAQGKAEPGQATTDAKGQFEIKPSEKQPLKPGPYKVTVRAESKDGKEPARSLLPPKYAEAATTPLSVELAPGRNRVVLELTAGE